jgi:hypothetical protein
MEGIAVGEANSTPTAVRRRILAILVSFSLFSYLLRMNISVAQQFMVPELGLSDSQVGQMFSSFMVGYALFQVPAAVWGDRRGPRFVLTVAVLGWGFLTLLTGLVPGLVVRGAAAAFVSLLILRFMLGMSEAATYPVAGRVVANWMPLAEHAFSNAVVMVGNTAGSALAPPLIAFRAFPNTVFRAGYGRYDTLNALGAKTGGPFTPGAEAYTNGLTCSAANSCAANFTLANAFPGGAAAVGGLSVSGVNPHMKRPITDQWNVSIEHALPQKISLRTSYIGSKSTDLPYMRNADIPPASLTPFTSSRLIYPQWYGVDYGDTGGNMTYNALEIEAKRRLTQGLYFDASYDWTKQLTDVDEGGVEYGWGPHGGAYGNAIEDPYDRARDKGNAEATPRHHFRSMFLFEPPMGKGKKFLGNPQGLGGGVLNQVFGGWTVSGMYTAYTGWWYTPYWTGFDATNTGNFLIRPDRVGSGVAVHQDQFHMFNPADFVKPAAGWYGNAAVGCIQGLGAWNLDASVWKSFNLWPRKEWAPKLQVGMTASNIFNHSTYNDWTTAPMTINSPSTVAITNDYYHSSAIDGGKGGWRIIRLEAHIIF